MNPQDSRGPAQVPGVPRAWLRALAIARTLPPTEARVVLIILGMPTPHSAWWIAKCLLLMGALVLFVIHSRLVFRLGAPLTQRGRRRALGWAGCLAVVYLAFGACLKAGYGYANRGRLEPNDGAWFRRQFASFGPIPAAYLFGPAFVQGFWASHHLYWIAPIAGAVTAALVYQHVILEGARD